jgi:hypothetical protein
VEAIASHHRQSLVSITLDGDCYRAHNLSMVSAEFRLKVSAEFRLKLEFVRTFA